MSDHSFVYEVTFSRAGKTNVMRASSSTIADVIRNALTSAGYEVDISRAYVVLNNEPDRAGILIVAESMTQ